MTKQLQRERERERERERILFARLKEVIQVSQSKKNMTKLDQTPPYGEQTSQRFSYQTLSDEN